MDDKTERMEDEEYDRDDLERAIRIIHRKLKCPDSDVKDLYVILEEIHIRIGSLLELMNATFSEINKVTMKWP